MYKITKQLSIFSAAHRLVHGYQGKCKDLHGHNYQISVTLTTDTLDKHGFVMDFSDIKALLDNWVQNHWDHATLVSEADPILLAFVREQKQTHYVLPNQVNTTAEALAAHAFDVFNDLLKTQHNTSVQLRKVTVWESPQAKASYRSPHAD